MVDLVAELATIDALDQLQRDVYVALCSPGRLYRPGEELSRRDRQAVRRVCEMIQEVRQIRNAALPRSEVDAYCDVMNT